MSGARHGSATAFAPASVGNAAVGFDLLGFVFPLLGDRVAVTRMDGAGVEVESVSGVADVPLDPARNTASAALASLVASRSLPHGFRVRIEKGIPLSAGLGGSAASAVGAVVAASALLDEPLSREELLDHAVAGECVASGSRHADNVAPCLLGGLTLIASMDPIEVLDLAVPAGVVSVLVHPHLRIETRAARAALRPDIALRDHVRQSAFLAAFVAACHRDDVELLGRCLRDVIVEPQRAGLLPGFDEAKRAAMGAGALGCSLAGSGPSVFAWARPADADAVRAATAKAFTRRGVGVDAWTAPIDSRGAHLVEPG